MSSLSNGVISGVRHEQTLFLTGGKSLHPFQRGGAIANASLPVSPPPMTSGAGGFDFTLAAAARTRLSVPPTLNAALPRFRV